MSSSSSSSFSSKAAKGPAAGQTKKRDASHLAPGADGGADGGASRKPRVERPSQDGGSQGNTQPEKDGPGASPGEVAPAALHGLRERSSSVAEGGELAATQQARNKRPRSPGDSTVGSINTSPLDLSDPRAARFVTGLLSGSDENFHQFTVRLPLLELILFRASRMLIEKCAGPYYRTTSRKCSGSARTSRTAPTAKLRPCPRPWTQFEVPGFECVG